MKTTLNGMTGSCPITRGLYSRVNVGWDCEWKPSGAIKKRLEVACDIKNKQPISKKFVTEPSKQEKMVQVKNFQLTGEYTPSNDFVLTQFAYTSGRKFPTTITDHTALADEICDVLVKIMDKPVSGYSF